MQGLFVDAHVCVVDPPKNREQNWRINRPGVCFNKS